MLSTIIKKAKEETVLTVAWLLAIISSIFVTPDKAYLSYIDWDTLALLFGLMCVMSGFKSMGLFEWMGNKLLSMMNTSRFVVITLVMVCFFSSMFITNDVALITFVPFAITTLSMAKLEERLVTVVVLQTIAANLGSMVTPIGNPQNIYLYFQSGYDILDFLRLTGPFALCSFILLIICSIIGENKAIADEGRICIPLKKDFRLLLYILLFLICLVSLSGLISVKVSALIVLLCVLLFHRSVIKDVDYCLLFTFIGFFIFVGNMGRIEFFQNLINTILSGREFLVTLAISQVISNVPATLLLSGFTHNWDVLIIASNIGGLGTLIASMANLISYKYICKSHPHFRHAYTRWFSILCLGFLIVLVSLYMIIRSFLA